MDKHILLKFCEELKANGLQPSKNITVEEQVAMFLMILAHSNSSLDNAEQFQHSTATVSKYFRIVLHAVNRFEKLVIVPPNLSDVPDCIGATDGVHIDVVIPTDQQTPFRGRKTTTTQNVMCVCSFDMRFTYVMSGWEGTANDSRILLETTCNPNNQFPMPPLGMVQIFLATLQFPFKDFKLSFTYYLIAGKYYVVDFGYSNIPEFLAPYRGYTAHFQEMRRRCGPKGREELFNYRHSSLCNVIECCFGVLKKRFSILKNICSYSYRKQTLIVIACCAIHNYIRMHAVDDYLFSHFEGGDVEAGASEAVVRTEFSCNPTQVREMAEKCDTIANQMWSDYNIKN
ncbi:Putative nuclease HARBI1 [Linum grandiflorum]